MNRLTWAEIMRRYPCQWMLLAGTEDDDGGNIESAHVLDYDRSANTLLDRTGLVPGATLIANQWLISICARSVRVPPLAQLKQR